LAVTAVSAGAQSTKYYIHDGDEQLGFIVQGGTLLSTYAIPSTDGYPMYPLRFSGSNFVVANRNGSAAVEYNANGVPTGNTYSNSQNLDQLLDGGTDGTSTYAVRCCSQSDGVYKGDMQFGSLTKISNLGETGVTYAISTGTVFATDQFGSLYEMSTSGLLLNTFSTGINFAAALAYESATNTLWIAQNETGQLYQLDLSGNQLQTFNVAGLQGFNYWAGEMPSESAVPEPATLMLLAPGLMGIAAMRRRLRSHKQ
jgi:hypothetical protein